MENLKIAGIQSDIYWHDRAANLAMFEEKIWQLDGQVDLILLPEMFTTGFTKDVGKMAEPMNLDTTKWMRQMASQTGAVITGSIIIQENGLYFNRLLWVDPQGNTQYYDKRHLFRIAEEDAYFALGKKQPIFQLKGWKILPQVCYDLRFPVWSRNRPDKKGSLDYDFSFYVASWPAARIQAWDILLKARAVENWCYTLGINRIGTDGNNIAYNGHSGLYDFRGDTIAAVGASNHTLYATLNGEALKDYREKFPAWKDADHFELGT